MSMRFESVCVDANDPVTLGRWWAELLGWRITESLVDHGFGDEDEVAVEPPAGSLEEGVSPELLFLRVPEGKTVKNRLHIDLRPVDQQAEVARAESLGAKRVDIGQGDEVTWVVLADPEGNEFCILRALKAEELADTA